MQATKKAILGAFATAAAAAILGLGVVALAPRPASADVFIGFGTGWGWQGHHYRPHYRPYFRPFYRPRHFGPRVIFFGPPVVYVPPPRLVYPPQPQRVYIPAPVSQPVRVNPASEPYRASNGLTCREYQTTATVGGQTRNVYGTACLQPDGAWRIVD